MILNVVFFILGCIFSAWILVNALLCIFFSIPYTKKLNNFGVLLDYNTIINRNKITITFNLGIFFLLLLVVTLFFQENRIYFYISTIIVLIISIGKLRENENNISDYMSSFENYIDFEKLQKYYNNQFNNYKKYMNNKNDEIQKINKNIKENIIENSWDAKHPPCPYCSHKNSYKKEYCSMCGKKIK